MGFFASDKRLCLDPDQMRDMAALIERRIWDRMLAYYGDYDEYRERFVNGVCKRITSDDLSPLVAEIVRQINLLQLRSHR